MTEILRLSYIVDAQGEYRADFIRDEAQLDEATWDWLKGAFVALGFDEQQVKEFFNHD